MRVRADSVEETTVADPGLSDLELTGATDGNRPFAIIGDGRECYYRVENFDLSQWEIGSGTYDAGTNSLSRDTVFYSSAGNGVKADLSGECIVYLTLLAREIVGAMLPLVSGSLPGPDLVADGNGQCIGVFV